MALGITCGLTAAVSWNGGRNSSPWRHLQMLWFLLVLLAIVVIAGAVYWNRGRSSQA
jgi:hypothetical protein